MATKSDSRLEQNLHFPSIDDSFHPRTDAQEAKEPLARTSPSSILNRVAAAGIAGVIALGAVGATGPAQAEPPARVSTTDIAQIKVPLSNAIGIQGEAVRMSAAMSSKDSNVIVFYGDVKGDPQTNAAFQSTLQAAKEVIAEGRIPLKGIIVADGSAIPRDRHLRGRKRDPTLQ